MVLVKVAMESPVQLDGTVMEPSHKLPTAVSPTDKPWQLRDQSKKNSCDFHIVTSFVFSDRGNCYFAGQNSALTSMWQTIDLTNYADPDLIDTQALKFNLSAWIGGYDAENDNAKISLTFLDQLNQTISSGITIGPVLAGARGNQIALLFRQTQGFVPAGTRFITVTVTITRTAGTIANGDVDNIALVLYP